jgi:hypothetical protein
MFGHNENLELQHKAFTVLEDSYTKIWQERNNQHVKNVMLNCTVNPLHRASK